jgi:hypothetical protein
MHSRLLGTSTIAFKENSKIYYIKKFYNIDTCARDIIFASSLKYPHRLKGKQNKGITFFLMAKSRVHFSLWM